MLLRRALEQLNVEAFGIVLPGHFFVRQKTKDGYQNLEMTNNGRILPDVFYRQVHLKNIYPENFRLLTKKEVIFVYISNLANYYKLKGYYDKAIELFNAALYVLPENASIYTNLGNAYERKKEIVKAGFQYQKALSINPYLCETHYNLGLLHFLYTGLKEEAYRHGQVVRKLGCPMNPDFERFLVEYELQKN
ncbi:MAG: tetratricopeptide repeat protein [Candidatus Omnitrophica bacterium]|nr:tetratricopeptide repeat protein [Candidatus Omnitrophota bacterium]